jgi:hypothetical protein
VLPHLLIVNHDGGHHVQIRRDFGEVAQLLLGISNTESARSEAVAESRLMEQEYQQNKGPTALTALIRLGRFPVKQSPAVAPEANQQETKSRP